MADEDKQKEEAQEAPEKETKPPAAKAKEGKGEKLVKKEPSEEVAPDDIPF